MDIGVCCNTFIFDYIISQHHLLCNAFFIKIYINKKLFVNFQYINEITIHYLIIALCQVPHVSQNGAKHQSAVLKNRCKANCRLNCFDEPNLAHKNLATKGNTQKRPRKKRERNAKMLFWEKLGQNVIFSQSTQCNTPFARRHAMRTNVVLHRVQTARKKQITSFWQQAPWLLPQCRRRLGDNRVSNRQDCPLG